MMAVSNWLQAAAAPDKKGLRREGGKGFVVDVPQTLFPSYY